MEKQILQFNEERHEYSLGGTILPSVTQIMSPLSSAHYGKVDKDILQKSAERGRIIHQAIQFYIEFRAIDIPDEYLGCLNAFIKFVADSQVEILSTEQKMYHPIYFYAGTLDILAKINGKITLIDVKTYEKFSPHLERVQLHGYASIYEANNDTKIDNKMIFIPYEDGSYKTAEYPAKDSEAKTIFESLYKVNRYIEKRS